MKAVLCIFFSYLLLCIPLHFKKKPKAVILFNNVPITKENALDNRTSFQTGKRIYYILITKKELKSDTIRVKVYSRKASANNTRNSLVYCNDFRLNKDNVYYYTDYIVMNSAGEYNMAIYSTDRLDVEITSADFKVVEN